MSVAEQSPLSVAGQELSALADNLPNPAWIAYADGYIFWYNRKWYDYTGTEPEDMAGWGWQAVHDPDELPRVSAIWTEAIASGSTVELTFPLRGADGIFRPFLTRVVPIRDAAGAVVRWFGTNVDISAQIAAEERIRQAEEDWRNLFDEIQEGFVVLEVEFDEDGRAVDAVIVKTNKQFENLTGVPLANAVGSSLTTLAGDAAPMLVEVFARVATTGASETIEAEVPTMNRVFEIRAYRHADHQVAAVYLDITARRAAEAEARQAQENLLRVSRLSAMGAMASTLAHELNQPIGAAANFVGAAREHLKRSETVDRALIDGLLAQGGESCLRAGRIIHHMREFTAHGQVASRAEDIAALIRRVVDDFRFHPAARGIDFALNIDRHLPLVACDHVQIEQVLLNLLTNSAQAMSATEAEARSIAIDARAAGKTVVLRVEDSGPGFGDREAERLFEPFWSTKDVSLGLGLPLCRTIVEAHGGTIAGEPGAAELGKSGGACFIVTLPIEGQASSPGAGVPPLPTRVDRARPLR